MRLFLETPAGTRTSLTSEPTDHISVRSSEKRVGIPCRMFGPGFMQRRQVWSVSEFQLVVGIACVAVSITHFISLELLWGPTIPTFFTVVRRSILI